MARQDLFQLPSIRVTLAHAPHVAQVEADERRAEIKPVLGVLPNLDHRVVLAASEAPELSLCESQPVL